MEHSSTNITTGRQRSARSLGRQPSRGSSVLPKPTPGRLSPEELVRHMKLEKLSKRGVTRKTVRRMLKRSFEEEKACHSIIFFVVLLVCFLTTFKEHLTDATVRGMEIGIEDYIRQKAVFAFATDDDVIGYNDIEQVQSVADFWSWLRMGFMPQIFPPGFELDEIELRGGTPTTHSAFDNITFVNFTRPSPARGEFMTYNTIIGGVRLHQRHYPSGECLMPEELSRLDPQPCFPTPGQGFYSPFSDSAYWTEIKFPSAIPNFFTDSDRKAAGYGREEFFDFNMTADAISVKIKQMEYGCVNLNLTQNQPCACESCVDGAPWIDAQTFVVGLTFFMLNREIGVWSTVRINFIFNRGGNIWQKFDIRSLWVDPYADNGVGIIMQDVWWCLMILYLVLNQVFRFAIGCYRRRPKSGAYTKQTTLSANIAPPMEEEDTHHYIKWIGSGAWRFLTRRVLEMESLVVISSVTLFFHSWIDQVRVVQSLSGAEHRLKDNWAMTQEGLKAWFALIEIELRGVVASGDGNTRLLLAVCVLLVLGCLLRGCHRHPRLAFVSKTLLLVASDLFHFAIVSVFIFCSFAAVGVAIFGTVAYEFSTPAKAITTLYLVLFGDNSWEIMERAALSHYFGVLYFVAYSFIVVILLLNMVLAMILDSYNEVHRELGKQEGIHRSTWRIARNRYEQLFGTRLNARFVYQAIKLDAKARAAREFASQVSDTATEPNPASTDGSSNTQVSPAELLFKKTKLARSLWLWSKTAVDAINIPITTQELMMLVPNIHQWQAEEILLDAHKFEKASDSLSLKNKRIVDAIQKIETTIESITSKHEHNIRYNALLKERVTLANPTGSEAASISGVKKKQFVNTRRTAVPPMVSFIPKG